MPASMTGFGRAVSHGLTVEIQSINRKYLEIFVSLPKEYSRFEGEVRKWVSEAITRGQISVRVSVVAESPIPDLKRLKELKKGWDKIAKELGTEKIDLPFLMQFLPMQVKTGEEKELKQGVKEALQGLLAMKETEGRALVKDLDGRLKMLDQMIEKVEKLSPDATQRMKEKLSEKLKELGSMDDRLLKEVAIFAERVDVAEEITRFRSHLSQFKGMLKEKNVGRKMDFLIQEMGREVNTIGSKSMEAKISHLVVEMKSELERMREQVQNIE